MGRPHAVLLVKGNEVLVDEEDYEGAAQFAWRIDATNGHVCRTPRNKEERSRGHHIYLHREVLADPEGLHIIHLNRDPLDCRKANLRAATRHQTRYADGPHSTRGQSRYKGITWAKGKWRVRVTTPFGRKSMGMFEDEENAARIYDEAARQYQGEHAYTNFPLGGD